MLTRIDPDRPVKKAENSSASGPLQHRPQPRRVPALPPGIADRVPQRDLGRFPQRRRVYNPASGHDCVTVCIAGICKDEDREALIMCSDTRLSYSGFSSDTGFKLGWAGPQMPAMIADSGPHADELLSRYFKHFCSPGLKLFKHNILDELRKPLVAQRENTLEQYLRLKWSIGYQDYLAGALRNLPPDEQSKVAADLGKIDFQCQLIIAVILRDKWELFAVDDQGNVIAADHFAVIGSGIWLAHAALCQREYDRWLRLPTAAYYIYEAKKLAQAETSVGPLTYMMALRTSGEPLMLYSSETMKWFDNRYHDFGLQRVAASLALPGGLKWGNQIKGWEQDEQKNLSGSPESGGDEKGKDGV